jgi:putative oxidoreductase
MRSLLPAPRTDLGLLLLRIAVAVIVIFHGVFKLKHGVAWIGGPLGKFGLPAWLGYGTYVAEVIGPVLLLLGVLARWAALAISFDMLMAIVLTGGSRVLTINRGGGGWGVELEALIGLSALAIAIAGPGRFAASRAM